MKNWEPTIDTIKEFLLWTILFQKPEDEIRVIDDAKFNPNDTNILLILWGPLIHKKNLKELLYATFKRCSVDSL